MSQLTFTWPARPSYAPEDFIISGANAEAVRFLETWPAGQSGAALISGPPSCGKTHLVLNWVSRHNASIIEPVAVGNTDSAALWQNATHAVLEDIHTIKDETALFHFLRYAETQGLFLLLTSRENAKNLSFSLADLRSRLISFPTAYIEAPDEKLLKAFLFKYFADRQLRVNEEVIEYLLKRVDRSFLAVYTIAETVEKRAFESGKPITIPLVKTLIV
jgi:chromosomal replication initiation ATPase DnaA